MAGSRGSSGHTAGEAPATYVLNTPTSGAGGRSCAEYANLGGGRTVLC